MVLIPHNGWIINSKNIFGKKRNCSAEKFSFTKFSKQELNCWKIFKSFRIAAMSKTGEQNHSLRQVFRWVIKIFCVPLISICHASFASDFLEDISSFLAFIFSWTKNRFLFEISAPCHELANKVEHIFSVRFYFSLLQFFLLNNEWN